MDCESCGRHRPSDQIMPTWTASGSVVMACARCRRHRSRHGTCAVEVNAATARATQASRRAIGL